ncbi:MAG TPA: superoxide dismutase family protein [Actinomycetota bacterium]|nr:superoxide dismutase family protein [Actinomycetota bacterium]
MTRSTRRWAVGLPVILLGAAGLTAISMGAGGASSACLEKNQAKASLQDAEGNKVGRVVFGVHSTCATQMSASARGLTAGFHGLHVHTTGTCDPAATDPNGNPSAFFTAGGHWSKETADHGSHTGDLPPLLVMEQGNTKAWSLTDRFQVRDLFDEDGSAVIAHAGPDNLANVPAKTTTGADRYHSHAYDTFGPDEDTRKTGDAGARFACGVVQKIKR